MIHPHHAIVHSAPAAKAGALAVAGFLVGDAANSSSPFVTVLVAVIAATTTLGGIYLTRRVNQVHVLVNSKMTEALAQIDAQDGRIIELETKLGLSPGESIPAPAIVTKADDV